MEIHDNGKTYTFIAGQSKREIMIITEMMEKLKEGDELEYAGCVRNKEEDFIESVCFRFNSRSFRIKVSPTVRQRNC